MTEVDVGPPPKLQMSLEVDGTLSQSGGAFDEFKSKGSTVQTGRSVCALDAFRYSYLRTTFDLVA